MMSAGTKKPQPGVGCGLLFRKLLCALQREVYLVQLVAELFVCLG